MVTPQRRPCFDPPLAMATHATPATCQETQQQWEVIIKVGSIQAHGWAGTALADAQLRLQSSPTLTTIVARIATVCSVGLFACLTFSLSPPPTHAHLPASPYMHTYA